MRGIVILTKNGNMTIKFCGAAQEVTGSCHLLTLDNGFRILLDCGLYQGSDDEMEDFNREWLFDPSSVDCVILSHAHIDHTGRLPKLVKDGYGGTIHCTHATRSLCSIMLLDSAKIQERDAEYYNRRLEKKKGFDDVAFKEPLYKSEHVHQTMEQFASYGYERWFTIGEGVEVLFRDAGHILGSASVTLRFEENGETKTFGFSGDVGRPNRPILRDPKPMPQLDYLLCESTYGDKEHEGRPAESGKLLDIIKHTCVEKGGKLIIPAFSVGRTQELVYMLDQMETDGQLPRIPVFVDSPLSVNATMIFGSHPECFDQELAEYMLIDPNPFGFNNLKYIRATEDSKALNTMEGPAIIISSSGMITAGRIKHHVFNNIDHKENSILIVGYCSPSTPCGHLRNGGENLRLFGEWKPVRAEVYVMDSFSAHADRLELLEFIKNQKEGLKTLFLVHGTLDRQESFRELANRYGFDDVQIPALGEEVNL
jgi:metallo-beta-lactamase family protein